MGPSRRVVAWACIALELAGVHALSASRPSAAQLLPEHLSPKNMTPSSASTTAASGFLPESLSAKNSSLVSSAPKDEPTAIKETLKEEPKEQPKEEPKEQPKEEVPKEEAKAEAPEVTKQPKEEPKKEEPKKEEPKEDGPKQEEPKKEEAKAPAVEPPKEVPKEAQAKPEAALEPSPKAKEGEAPKKEPVPPTVPGTDGMFAHAADAATHVPASERLSVPASNETETSSGCVFLGVYTLPEFTSPTARLSTEVILCALFIAFCALALTGKCIFGGWLGTATSFLLITAGVVAGALFGLLCWWIFYSSEGATFHGHSVPELKVGFITGSTWWFWILFTLVSAAACGFVAWVATKLTAIIVGTVIGFCVGSIAVMATQVAFGLLPMWAYPTIIIACCLLCAIICQIFLGGDEKGERLIAIATALLGGTLAAGVGRMVLCINAISTPSYTDLLLVGIIAATGLVVQLCLCSNVTFNRKEPKK